MSKAFVLVGPLTAAYLGSKDGPGDELPPPVRMQAAGKSIDTDVGHAAPFVADFDGDGKLDLLVGQRKPSKADESVP